MPQREVLVVGAGFAGAVTAERLASAGARVRVIERRAHIGGNAFDTLDENGILVHRYGPHIFHTQSDRVFSYLSRFTDWRPYEHRVLASVEGELYPIPINQTTINRLYGLDLDENGVERFLQSVAIEGDEIRTSEDVVLRSVGPDLCEKFFRGYTRKQWGLDLSELSATVASRIPTRTNTDDRYFNDRHQAMPLHGYTRMFESMLDHPRITVETGVDYFAEKARYRPAYTIYTGPVDRYFDFVHGTLPYRSIRFEHENHPAQRYQATGTVNYPNDHDYTRITEFRWLTGQEAASTSIVKEFPTNDGDPYYPVPNPDNEARYQRYKALAKAAREVFFVGRLAQYRYYNMDQVVAAALKLAARITGEETRDDDA